MLYELTKKSLTNSQHSRSLHLELVGLFKDFQFVAHALCNKNEVVRFVAVFSTAVEYPEVGLCQSGCGFRISSVHSNFKYKFKQKVVNKVQTCRLDTKKTDRRLHIDLLIGVP